MMVSRPAIESVDVPGAKDAGAALPVWTKMTNRTNTSEGGLVDLRLDGTAASKGKANPQGRQDRRTAKSAVGEKKRE